MFDLFVLCSIVQRRRAVVLLFCFNSLSFLSFLGTVHIVVSSHFEGFPVKLFVAVTTNIGVFIFLLLVIFFLIAKHTCVGPFFSLPFSLHICPHLFVVAPFLYHLSLFFLFYFPQ